MNILKPCEERRMEERVVCPKPRRLSLLNVSSKWSYSNFFFPFQQVLLIFQCISKPFLHMNFDFTIFCCHKALTNLRLKIYIVISFFFWYLYLNKFCFHSLVSCDYFFCKPICLICLDDCWTRKCCHLFDHLDIELKQ